MKSNLKDDVCYAQPKNLSDRLAIANDFTKRFNYPVPFGVDGMNNAANDAYAAWPERLYILDENGKIAYRGGMGPFNYNPAEVRSWLAARYGEVKHPETKPADSTAPKAQETPAAKLDDLNWFRMKKGGTQLLSNSALGVFDRLGKRSSEHELKGVAVAEQYSEHGLLSS
jgi:type I thyroxine 5'-deiodinase